MSKTIDDGAGPLAHGLGLLPGATTVAGTGLAGLAAITAGFDLPGAFHESSDRFVKLLDILRRKIDLVVGSVDSEGEGPLRLRTIDVVNELADYLLRHVGSLLTINTSGGRADGRPESD